MKELNPRQFRYRVERIEGPPPIPCDMCQGGMDTSPWHIVFWLGDVRAYDICAADAMEISLLVDTCSDCIHEPTEERICDNCGKEYLRKKPVAEVAA